jgi:hypothetical protein
MEISFQKLLEYLVLIAQIYSKFAVPCRPVLINRRFEVTTPLNSAQVTTATQSPRPTTGTHSLYRQLIRKIGRVQGSKESPTGSLSGGWPKPFYVLTKTSQYDAIEIGTGKY